MSDVFISYSRQDTDFVRQLFDALHQHQHDAWVDWQGIDYSTRWWEEICAGIQGANNFVLILSPDSLTSEYCHREIEHARQHNKRVVTLIYRDYDEVQVVGSWYKKPFEEIARSNLEYLKTIQFISLPKLGEFDRVLATLIDTVDRDPEHVKTHTELLLAARAWEDAGRSPGYLLRRERLVGIETWLAEASEAREPQPTSEQRVYIAESRRVEDELAREAAAQERRTRDLELQTQAAAVENERLGKRSQQFRRATMGFGIVGIAAALIAAFMVRQVAVANQQIATATAEQGIALAQAATAMDAEQDAIQAQSTSAAREATANSQIATATVALSTATAVALAVEEAENRIESLRLAVEAKALLNEGGNAETAALLSIRALKTAFTVPADEALDDALERGARRSFTAQAGGVTSVAFSPDGEYVLTGNVDGTTRLWEVATGDEVRQFISDAVFGVAYSPDGQQVLTVGGMVQLWDAETGEEVQQFSPAGEVMVMDAALSPDGQHILTGYTDGIARLWDVTTGEEVRQLISESDAIIGVAFSPDGRYILTNGDDNYAHLWDVRTGEALGSLFGSRAGLGSVGIFRPDGRQIFVSTTTGTAWLWDVEAGEVHVTFSSRYSGYMTSAAYSPDGWNVVVNSGNAALLWNVSSDTVIRRFSGHGGDVTSVAFSPDGRYILTGSMDGTARLWDVEPGREERRFTAAEFSPVLEVVLSRDGRQMAAATGRPEMEVRVWDTSDSDSSRLLVSWGGDVTDVAFSPNGQYTLAGVEDVSRMWDATTGVLVREFSGHSDAVTDVAYSPNGQYVLTGSADHTARLWNAATGEVVRTFAGHTATVTSVAFSPEGRSVLSLSWDTLQLWNPATGEIVRTFANLEYAMTSAAFSPDGHTILIGECPTGLSGCSYGMARLVDAETGEELHQFSGDGTNVAFSPDGQYILSSVRLWDAATGEVVRESGGFAFSPDGKSVLSSAGVWDVATGEVVSKFSGHLYTGANGVFSPDGRWVLNSSSEGVARLWDVATGELVRLFNGHANVVVSVAFSPDGQYLLTGSLDSTAQLWDVATGSFVRQFIGHTSDIRVVMFSPDGRFVLTDSRDGTVRLWDAGTGEELRQFRGGGDYMTFSPDGRYVLIGSILRVYLWDTEAWEEVYNLELANGYVGSVAFSPDGREKLALSSNGNMVWLWDAETGEERNAFIGEVSAITRMALSPDGRLVFTASDGLTELLWDAATGEIARLHSGWHVTSVVFSPDGRYVYIGYEDGTVRRWHTDYEDFIDYACTRVYRDFLDAERLAYGLANDGPTCEKFRGS